MKKVLVAAAHMDDEVLGLAGTIAKHVAAGDSVTVCVCSKRAYNHKFDVRSVEKEQAACRKAAKVLGYRDLRFFDLPDERLDEKLLQVIVPLEKAISEVKPQVVYLPHRGDNNQDHRAVFHAGMVACRSIARHKVKRLLSYEVLSSTEQAPPLPSDAFLPNFYVEITPFLKKKLAAMSAYRRELKPFPHPRSLKGIEVLARKRGMEIGFKAAEGFMVLREEWK